MYIYYWILLNLFFLWLCWYQDSGFPCFKGGIRTIQNLRKRFHLSLTEEVPILLLFVFLTARCFGCDFDGIVLYFFWQQCVSLVLSLISSSLDAWRTRQYDYYQRVLNGILWDNLTLLIYWLFHFGQSLHGERSSVSITFRGH